MCADEDVVLSTDEDVVVYCYETENDQHSRDSVLHGIEIY